MSDRSFFDTEDIVTNTPMVTGNPSMLAGDRSFFDDDEDEQEEQDDSPVTIPVDGNIQNVTDTSADVSPMIPPVKTKLEELDEAISTETKVSKSVYEINKEYNKLKAERKDLAEELGGEDKIDQLQEEAIEAMIKELDETKTVNGQPSPWMALFNDTTNGHGTRFALNLMSTVSKYTPIAQAKTTDFIASIVNSIQETDEFMEDKLGFGLAPKVVEDSLASFLFKSNYGFENDKNANEYATQIMKLLGETAVLSESVLGIASAPVKVGTALRNPLGDIITTKDIGFEKGKLMPFLNAADEKKLNKEIQALVKNTQKQIKRETELGNKFRENNRMFSPKITDISVANARRVNNDYLDKIDEANKKIVDDNPDIAENAIFAIEDGLAHNARITEKYIKQGKTLLDARRDEKWLKIHYIDNKGKMRYDPDLAREVGRKTTIELDENVKLSRRIMGFGDVTMEGDALGKASAMLRTDMDSPFTQPVLIPEKFDALVALASNLSKKYPQKFRSKNVIDDLYKMAADPDIEVDGTEIVAELNKVGLSFEDYIMTVVGSGSEAGKILQKLSMIKRKRDVNGLVALQEAKESKQAYFLYNAARRFENVRRGGLVSQVVTAIRNASSFVIRSPLEALGGIADEALYQSSLIKSPLDVKQIGKTLGAFSPVNVKRDPDTNFLKLGYNWKDSTRNIQLLFEDQVELQGLIDLILKRPQFLDEHRKLFDNLNEMQKVFRPDNVKGLTKEDIKLLGSGIYPDKLLRRASAQGVDGLLTVAEDFVGTLNTPNRIQEHIIRRTAFFSELEKLTKREYGVDLVRTLNTEGGLQGLLNDKIRIDNPDFRSFAELITDSTTKALDVSYSKKPEFGPFKFMEGLLVRSVVGTTIMPFPRFFFSQLELMAQYAGGAPIAVMRRLMNISETKMLDAKSREMISRNIVGWAAISAAMQYRESPDAPADYKKIRTDNVEKAIREADRILEYSYTGDAEKYMETDVSGRVDIDISPNHPLRPIMWLAEAKKRFNDKTFNDWFDAKEFVQTFGGPSLRMGVSQDILQGFVDIANGIGQKELGAGTASAKALGQYVGNYTQTWLVPYNQFLELERFFGMRGRDIYSRRPEATLSPGQAFLDEITSKLSRFESPSKEAQRVTTLDPFIEDYQQESPSTKLFGVRVISRNEEYGEFLERIGFKSFEIMTREKNAQARKFEASKLQSFLRDVVVPNAMKKVENNKKVYNALDDGDFVKSKNTENSYNLVEVRAYISSMVKGYQQTLQFAKKGKRTELENAIIDYKKLSKNARRAAIDDFHKRFQRDADLTSATDIKFLNISGKVKDKIFTAPQKAFSKELRKIVPPSN